MNLPDCGPYDVDMIHSAPIAAHILEAKLPAKNVDSGDRD